MVLCWEFWMLSAVSGLPCFCWWVSYSYCCVLCKCWVIFPGVFSIFSLLISRIFKPWCVSVDLCFHCTVLVVPGASQICRLLFLNCGKFSRLFFEGFFIPFPPPLLFFLFMPWGWHWCVPCLSKAPSLRSFHSLFTVLLLAFTLSYRSFFKFASCFFWPVKIHLLFSSD